MLLNRKPRQTLNVIYFLCHIFYVLRKKLKEILDKKPTGNVVAAVLVPIIESSDPKLVMIIRSKNLKRSAGHIAFPGGMIEDNEEPVDTALREAREELGICDATVLGYLKPKEVREYRIKLCPVVGIIKNDKFKPDNIEVSRVLVDSFKNVLKSRRVVDWGPCFECCGEIVWGASSRVLDELYLRIVKRYGSIDSFFEA